MPIVKPFKAVRPSRDKVALVSSKSFDEYTAAEVKSKLDFNPFTFLHVINPDYKYQQEVSGDKRFKMVHNRYLEFKENGVFIQDKKPSLYVYEVIDNGFSSCGIIASISVDDFKKGKIKGHEETIEEREILFKHYLKITGFNAEPVLLTYKDNEDIDSIINQIKEERAEYEFSTQDKRLHKMWLIENNILIDKISNLFLDIPSLYIADGHHRTTSSCLLADDLAEENLNHNGSEDYNFFMSLIIPESNLKISEFNRFVKDLNGYTPEEFLVELDTYFTIENKGHQFYKPKKKNHFSMYMNGEFYSLILRKMKYSITDSLSSLDAEILFKTILSPILGINDLKNNKRIGYSNNKVDSLSIKTKVDKGEYKVGFGLLPISVDEIKNVANEKLKMPPKTTYIEPKLRSGLTLYEF